MAGQIIGGKKGPPTHWICGNCSSKMIWKRMKCSKCQGSRPELAGQQPQISPPAAQRESPHFDPMRSDLTRRLKAGGTNMSGRSESSTGPIKTWRCPQCATENAGNRTTCGICPARRPSAAELAAADEAARKLKEARDLAWQQRLDEEPQEEDDFEDENQKSESSEDEDDFFPSSRVKNADDGVTVGSGKATSSTSSSATTGEDGATTGTKKKKVIPVYLPKRALAPVADAKELWRKATGSANGGLEGRAADGSDITTVMTRKTKEEQQELNEYRNKRRDDMRATYDDFDIDDFGRKRRRR
ncbi:unnamed protein product [Amoebophrya sp. A25]|nr:unnamed protein product [Amoebophrya sp. A25]|eukprot:GSA25T00002057001.1